MSFWRVFIVALIGGATAQSATVQELALWIFVALVAWLFIGKDEREPIDDAVDRGLERFARRYRR